MSKIAFRWNTELEPDDLRRAFRAGARCVRYDYAVSCVVLTMQFQSKVHLVRSSDGLYGRGIPYMFVSLLLGPWALPWGPLVTMQSIWDNFRGGHDVTQEISAWLDAEAPQ